MIKHNADIAFGSTGGAHFIPAFRAFVHDNGMPGVRLMKDSGGYFDVIFSTTGILELQEQLFKALQMMNSSSRLKQ